MTLNKLQLSACSYALIAMSVHRRQTQPCSYGLAGSFSSFIRRLHPSVGAVRRNFDVQVTFCPLTSLGITADRCPSSRPKFGYPTELTKQRQLGSRLARTGVVFDSVCTEFRHRGPLILLHSDNSVETSALARPDSLTVYFVPLQLFLSSNQLGQCSPRSCELDVLAL